MKYNILVNCKNPIMLMDFIHGTGAFFKSLSTSECLPDIIGHFEIFKPDAYICFVDSIYSSKIFTQTASLKSSEFYNGAPIIIIADAETCKNIELKYPNDFDLLITRPISPDNLTLRITRYFEETKPEKSAGQQLWAQSEEEPVSPAPAAAVTVPAAAPAPGEKKHILVIDDDRVMLKMLKSALSDQYDVTILPNSISMAKCLETKKVDLILLDYEMPLETGADVFRRIKEDPKSANIPVCFLTGISDREKTMEIMALKPHGYLLKPIDMNMLFSTISNLIN